MAYRQLGTTPTNSPDATTKAYVDAAVAAGGGGGGGIASVSADTSPALGGNLSVGSFTVGAAAAADLTKLHALTATSTELNYVAGVTSAIQTQLSGKVPTTRTVNGSALSSDVTLTQDNVGDGTTYKQYSATDKTKLAGIATGATANSSDATLEARANHTGTQSADTLTDGTTNKAFLATERTKLTAITGTNTGDQTTITGNAGTATKLAAAANINGVPFDGSGAITINAVDSTAREPSITAGTSAQYWRGDKTFQALNADAVPDGTTNKAYTATEKTKLAGVAAGATANSSDATLEARANHTGTQAESTVTNLVTDLAAKAPLASPAFTGTPTGITATHVGLGNVDNTSDVNKPVSTAQQTALNLKANLASPTFTGTVAGITASMVGLGNVDNTSDASKPVSTAQATADSGVQAYAIQRANHTGTQIAATISDFSTAADARVTAAVGVSVQAYDSDLTAFAAKTAPAGAVVGTTDTQTLSGKTIDGGSNTLTNIPTSAVVGYSADLSAKADLVGGVVPTSQMPSLALNTTVTVADQTAMLALTSAQVQPGDVAVRTDGAGSFMLVATPPSTLSNWILLSPPTDVVTSVNSQQGLVVLGKADVGLGNVDNTSNATERAAAATITSKTISGSANTLTNIAISSLTITGTPNGTEFLRDDGSWQPLPPGGIVWNNVTGTSQTAAVGNAYIANNAALVTVTLPSTYAVGDIVRVAGGGAGGWKVAQPSGDNIVFGATTTTTGTGGYLASTQQYDAVELVAIAANTTWSVISSQGNAMVV